jgi:hypothetical protein
MRLKTISLELSCRFRLDISLLTMLFIDDSRLQINISTLSSGDERAFYIILATSIT